MTDKGESVLSDEDKDFKQFIFTSISEWQDIKLTTIDLVERIFIKHNRKVAETLDRVEAELPKGSFYTPESLEGKTYWEAIAEVKKAISKIRG